MTRLFVVSGAGLSAESGLATFRDKGGLWAKYDLEKICHFKTWRANRDEVFEFYNRCKTAIQAVSPTEGHKTLASWQRQFGAERVHLLTQNIDDLLERAGAEDVTHLHGDTESMVCADCGARWLIGNGPYVPQPCPICGSSDGAKPGIVFFGERAPNYRKLSHMQDTITMEDILIVVGSSMQVLPPQMLMPTWRYGHGRNWQVNPVPVECAFFGRTVKLPADEGLSRLEPLLYQLMD